MLNVYEQFVSESFLFTGFLWMLRLTFVGSSSGAIQLFSCFTSKRWSAAQENPSRLCRLSFLLLEKCVIVMFWLTWNLCSN